MELDQEVFGAIAALNGAAWIAGGDWNRTPEMIAESGATEPVGGFIAPGREQVETCVPEKGEHRVLDFFILGPGIRDVNTKVEVLLDSTIATHRPVQATFTGNPMVQEVMGLTVPKPYEFTPLQLKTRNYVKHKEVPEPRRDDTEQAITRSWRAWNITCEIHLARITGAKNGGKDFQGRGCKPELSAKKATRSGASDGFVRDKDSGWFKGVARKLSDLAHIKEREQEWRKDWG
jgi:hypothetical protein